MLLEARTTYRPFLYPQATEWHLAQQQAHWLWTGIGMAKDISDFRSNLNEAEKHAIITILKLFTQTEINVEEYWSAKVSKWFPHPEIQQMTASFAAFEAIHISSYDYLNQSLGISDYDGFLLDPVMKNKIDKLNSVLQDEKDIHAIARSLAVFSAFTEGVNLFSSFAVLMNFGRFNKMQGVGQIVAYSSRDETLHSQAGCWLFRQLISEYPEIWTDEFKKTIYQAARDSVELEDAYIDRVFEKGDLPGLTSKQLKTFIRFRADTKLQDLGLKRNWKNIDMDIVRSVTEWFDMLAAGNEQADFFFLRPTAYSKSVVDFSNIKIG